MATPEASSSNPSSEAGAKSALQDNLLSKGKNAYYFAHRNTPTGPKWDGKPQPRLLSTHSSTDLGNGGDSNTSDLEQETGDLKISSINNHARSLIQGLKDSKSSFDFAKSNITKYAFLDDGKKVKIYIDMKGVGEICNADEDVKLDWDERSFSLKIHNYQVPPEDEEEKESAASSAAQITEEVKDVQCLSFGRLHGSIRKATVKVKPDRIILTLFKKVEEGEDPEEWPAIAQKGESEHEIL